MKYLWPVLSVLIFIFWATMNTVVVLRERQIAKQDRYQRHLNEFLDKNHRRERWMGIYQRSPDFRRKLGYTGMVIERLPGTRGIEYHTDIETVVDTDAFNTRVPLLNWLLGEGRLSIKARLIQDDELKPEFLSVELQLPKGGRLSLSGRRDGDVFRIQTQGGQSVKIPVNKFVLGNGFVPTLPLAGLNEGDSFQVAAFDTVSMRPQNATVTVTDLRAEQIDGVFVDVYELETDLGGRKSSSLVTQDGTLLRVHLGAPFAGIELRRERRESARRGMKK